MTKNLLSIGYKPMANIVFDENELEECGENVKSIVIDDEKLILVVDLGESIGLSSTGKMMGVASTGGFSRIPGTKLSLNMYCGKKNL